MSINHVSTLLIGTLISAFAIPPEVIGSCRNNEAVRPSVTISPLPSPLGMPDDNVEAGCVDHFEKTSNNFTFGYITCNDNIKLIVKGSRYDAESAQNLSVNPNVGSGGEIFVTANWRKIQFNNIDYLCIDNPLSSSGYAGNVSQYYIIENAFNSNTPILYYYFFDKEITPIDSIN